MPHGFEYIVRPFQSPGSLGNVVIPGTPQRTAELARISWGGQGRIPETKILNPSTVVHTRKDELQELERDNTRQRIIGNDGESYVDVDRPDEVRLHGRYLDTSSGLAKIFYTTGIEHDASLDPYLKNFTKPTDTIQVEGPVTWKFINPAS